MKDNHEMKLVAITQNGTGVKLLWGAPIFYYLCVTGIVIFALIVRGNVALKHCVPRGDEGAWLRLAARLPDKDFMTSRVIEHDHYAQRVIPHPEDNRSPLYPVMIALFHVFIPDIYRAGQVLNLLVSVLFLIIVAFFMRHYFGTVAALSSLVFFAASPFLIQFSAQIYPDLLIALCFFVGLQKANRMFLSNTSAFIAGIGFGLLILLKSTALFLLPVIVVENWDLRKEKGAVKRAVIFAVSSLALVAPWVVRNYRVFGSPFYQVAKYTLYMESFKDFFDVNLATPSLAGYISQFGLFHVFLVRPFLGFLEMVRLFPHFDHNLSFALVPFCSAGVFALKGKRMLYRPIVIFSAFYLPFMANIAYNSWVARYIMVFYVFVYCCAGAGIGLIGERVRNTKVRYLLVGTAILFPLSTVAYPIEFYLSGRGNEYHEDRVNRMAVQKAIQKIPAPAVVLSPFLSQYCFMHELNVVNALHFKTIDILEKFIDIYAIKYVLINENHDDGLWKLVHDPERGFRLGRMEKIDTIVLFNIEQ